MTDRRERLTELAIEIAAVTAVGMAAERYGPRLAASSSARYAAVGRGLTGFGALLRFAGTLGLVALPLQIAAIPAIEDAPNRNAHFDFRGRLERGVRSELQTMRDELAAFSTSGRGVDGDIRLFLRDFDLSSAGGSFAHTMRTMHMTEQMLTAAAASGDGRATEALQIMHRHMGRIMHTLQSGNGGTANTGDGPQPMSFTNFYRGLDDILRASRQRAHTAAPGFS